MHLQSLNRRYVKVTCGQLFKHVYKEVNDVYKAVFMYANWVVHFLMQRRSNYSIETGILQEAEIKEFYVQKMLLLGT